MLSWGEFLRSVWRLWTLSFRVVLHRKLAFLVGGVLAYYGILYALAVFRPGEGFSAAQAMLVLVEIPGTVLAIYLTMDLVSGERDQNTLEILFSTSSSHTRIWLVRMTCVYAVLGVVLLGMSTLSYFFFAEFPFVLGGLNALLPAFLMVNLTFYFSVTCRSGNAAGMLGLGFLVVVLLTSGALQNTPYFLFQNPFEPPVGTDDFLWVDRVVMNRVAVAALGGLFLLLALRRMSRRERLLTA